MIERDDIVVAVIEAAPARRLISRVRLQKSVYLLERLGFESGLEFEYHHYGPYSRELDNATADAKALGRIDEKILHRSSDGAAYSVFESSDVSRSERAIYGTLGEKKAREFVAKFADTNVTVLELAATIDWLWRFEEVPDWRSEVEKRKKAKVGGGKLERAVELLKTLDLSPP